MRCSSCKVVLGREKAKEHYLSELHAENVRRKAAGAPALSEILREEETMDTKEVKDECRGEGMCILKEGECFYCPEIVGSLHSPEYLMHLKKHHFRFPNEQWLADRHGLMDYLKEKIEHCICTYCGKRFGRIESARRHMEDLGHSRYTDSDEFGEFYCYPEPSVLPLSEDGTELVLGDGKVAGSRRYSRYYQQKLREPGYYGTREMVVRREETDRSAQAQERIAARLKRRNDLKVSISANIQMRYREDWMQ
jgi:C2H2 type zinc-finger (2 copies)